jgi:FMN reductase
MRPPLIVGLGGTTADGSATERVLRAALDATAALGARTLLFAGADLDLPMYAPGRAGQCPRARALVEALAGADGVIVASPAYHGTVSGLVKNALDHAEELRCAARPYLEGRAVGCVAVAGGAQAGAATLATLRSVAHALRGWPTPMGVAVDTSDPVFGVDGAVDDAVVLGRLDLLAGQLVGFARATARAEPVALPRGRSRRRIAPVRYVQSAQSTPVSRR